MKTSLKAVLIAGALIFFIFPTKTEAAINFTKAQTGVAGSATTGTTVSCVFASNPTTGNLVTAGVLFYDGGSTPPTFTVADGSGNNYTVDSNNSGSTNMSTAGYISQAYLLSAPANANKTITVTFNKTIVGAGAIWCDVWTPSEGTVSYDSGNVGSGTDTINTPTITVSGTNELIYCTASDGDTVTAATSPFTLSEGGLKFGNASEWVTGQSANRACAFTGSGGAVYNAVGMSFKITTVTRSMRLFNGYRIKFISGRIILHQKQ